MENLNPLWITAIGLIFSVAGGILGWDEGTIAEGKELAYGAVSLVIGVIAWLQAANIIKKRDNQNTELKAELQAKEIKVAELSGQVAQLRSK